MTASKFDLILTGAISAAVFFWLGYFSAEFQYEMSEIEFPVIPVPECPEPKECPPLALHDKVMEAKCEARIADAYVRGTEDAHDAALICAQAFNELKSCKVKECGQGYMRLSLDMMSLGLQTMHMDVEQSHWHRCCEDLIRVWPTPGGEYGTYPEDFPKYCQ